MSYALVDAVFDLKLPHAEKATLQALARHAHDDGKHSFPSIALLAREACLSERSIQRALLNLERAGFIRAVSTKAGGKHSQTTHYEILFPNADMVAAIRSLYGKKSTGDTVSPVENDGCQPVARRGETVAPTGDTVAPKSVRESEKGNTVKSSVADARRNSALSLLPALQRAFGKKTYQAMVVTNKELERLGLIVEATEDDDRIVKLFEAWLETPRGGDNDKPIEQLDHPLGAFVKEVHAINAVLNEREAYEKKFRRKPPF